VFYFQYEDDARNFYKALKERLAKFGLELSEEKSKIMKFGRFAGKDAGKFDFLGFTVIRIMANMHTPIGMLIRKLNAKLRGHYNYYGLSHNMKKMSGFYGYVRYMLFKALKRRSSDSKMNWDKFNRIMEHNPLLRPKITVPLW